MQDDKTHWSLTVPLTPEQMAWWQDRMRETIFHVRETFPKARIGEFGFGALGTAADGPSQCIASFTAPTMMSLGRSTSPTVSPYLRKAEAKLIPFFAVRVHQLRHLQDDVARSEGLPIFGEFVLFSLAAS